MNKLILHNKYTREEVHSIFDGGITKFTAGAGIWGLHGIVQLPKRKHDHVFFVTIGQDKLGVAFKESISEDGILTWQSQKKHDLKHKKIIEFINHDYLKHNIYLFLRPDKKQKEFRYMGKLAYVDHDPVLEKPVHFKWQLIDWIEENRFEEIKIESVVEDIVQQKNSLCETNPPESRQKRQRVNNFKARKSDYVARNEENTKVGLETELLVLEYTKKELIQAGKRELAEKVIHTSVVEGDGSGYDIQSFRPDGSVLYIEVKGTKGGVDSEFFLTPNEIAFSEEYSDQYELIRVFDYCGENNSGMFYKVEGCLVEKLKLTPTQYRARI